MSTKRPSKNVEDSLGTAKQIMERLLKTPPDPKTKQDKGKKLAKRTSGKGRARLGKGKN